MQHAIKSHHPGGAPALPFRRALLRGGLGLTGALALSGLAGCGGSEPGPDQPLPVGDLPVRLRALIQEAGIPGALVRVQTPEGLYADALRQQHQAHGVPRDPATGGRGSTSTR